MEITVQREKYEGQYQIRCYHCRSILTYQERDVHRNPGANRILQNHGFVGYTGEIRCPNCHTWLPHYPANLMQNDKIVVAAVTVPSIKIGDHIREIGNDAFRQEQLSSVVLPQGLERIGRYAFAETFLNSITIPERVQVIEDYAFYGCTYLQEVIFDGAPTIGLNAFLGCQNIHKIVLKNMAFPQEIRLFQGCEALETIECPNILRDYANRVLAEVRGRKWKAQGKCTHCGGEFTKGLIKKCSVCGQKKNY